METDIKVYGDRQWKGLKTDIHGSVWKQTWKCMETDMEGFEDRHGSVWR